MENNEKKKYEKPQVTKIRLDAQCAVLGFCKSPSNIGPNMACNVPTPCSSQGS